jgi:hypothetical protein
MKIQRRTVLFCAVILLLGYILTVIGVHWVEVLIKGGRPGRAIGIGLIEFILLFFWVGAIRNVFPVAQKKSK